MRTNTPRPGAIRIVLMLAALLLTHLNPPAAHADNLTKLYSFANNYNSGNQPQSKLIQASDGYLYGTTLYGGVGYGTIFRMSTSGTVTTLYSFDNTTTGYYPYGGLYQDSTGAFYGATRYGGANTAGVVYKMTIAIVSGNPVATVTPYWSFKGFNSTTPSLSEPGTPLEGELIKGSDGKLYGTTYQGGVNNYGAAYSLTIVTSGTPTLTIIHSFNSGAGAGGYYPYSGVTEGSDGKLYGTTYNGGANGAGVVYSLTKDGLTYTDIHDFSAGADGSNPWSQLTKSSTGVLYGTTVYGGGTNDGTLYKVSSGVYSQLYAFDGNTGQYPVMQPIIAADGKLYGTTQQGGSSGNGNYGAGVVYKYDLTANTISVFGNFDGTNGYYVSSLTQGTDKNFYGTSQYGGLTSPEAAFNNGNGSAFKVSSSGTITLLYSFYTHTGYYPLGRTVQGPDGQFYGTTNYGGYHDSGTIYKADANGNVTILHHFNNNRPGYEGYYPNAELIVGKDGNLYGSTTAGGLYGNGTIFKISTSGSFSLVYSLRGIQGSNIFAPLLQGKDGYFYGVAYSGGVNGYGTIFKLAGSTFTVLHHFGNINGQGTYPYYGLAQDTTGNLYGTTLYGGANGVGSIYEINTTGTSFNTVYSFTSGTGNKGYYSYAQLLYTGGMMYGVTSSGGANGYGTIFKFTPSTTSVTPTDVHDFAYATDGYSARYGLSLGPDGKLYGATYQSGANGGGVAFSIDTSDNYTNLYSFNNSPSTGVYYPQDGLIVGSDNNLYLGTRNAGDFNYGTFSTIDISLHYAVNVSTSVTVTLGTLTLSGGTYNGNLTVKNISKTNILGPVNVVLTGLTGGTTLVNKTGDVPAGYGTATGKPYIQAAPTGSAHGIFALGAGKSVTIPVKFSANTGTSATSQTWLRRF